MIGHPERTQGRSITQPQASVPDTIEEALRAAISRRVGEARFGLWFGDGVKLALSGDRDALEVRVPDPFFREWIRVHYTSSLLEAAETVVGRSLQLSIRINDEAQPPLGDVVAPKPPPPPSDPVRRHNDPSLIARDSAAPPPFAMMAAVSGDLPEVGAPSSAPRIIQQPSPTPSQGASPGGTIHAAGPTPRRLQDFVTGPANRLAHAAAHEMARSAGAAYNPLVIHSAVGLGKTHLLDGIGHALKQMHPALHVIQLTAESFTNGFLEAMRSGNLSRFRARHRNAAGFIVDDVHFLAAKRATQDEFLHTFDALINRGAPIVLATEQHPRLISGLPEELVTRFLGGMVVKIDSPDLATRQAILLARAKARGADVPEAVISYIAENVRSSVRELEGGLYTVLAQAALSGKRLDLDLAKTALRDTIRHTAHGIALRDIEQAICQFFQLSGSALKSESRSRALTYPRMLAMFLARKHTTAAYSEIGRYFGGRNHSTVISAEKRVQSWLQTEQRSALLPGFESVIDLLADLERALKA